MSDTETARDRQPNSILLNSIKFSGRRAFIWGCLYYAMRSAIIMLGVLTTVSGVEQLSFLSGKQALFAALVTLLTALDSWLKPDIKYRAYYVANDEYLVVQQKWEQSVTADPSTKQLIDEYNLISQRLQKAAMP